MIQSNINKTNSKKKKTNKMEEGIKMEKGTRKEYKSLHD